MFWIFLSKRLKVAAMFTGLIQHIGVIKQVIDKNDDLEIIIEPQMNLSDTQEGASIACSGVCLTAINVCNDQFTAYVSKESLSKTVIADWRVGRRINIEPSLRMGDALGGHFVFGHVDGLATVDKIVEEGDSYRLTIKPPYDLMPYLAPKGSVALDGISLTVNEIEDKTFGVNIIPHTWTHTTLCDRIKGDRLHIEIDMLARYVARQMEFENR